MTLDKLVLISVDDHICEPADMFERHVPERYRNRPPCVVVEDDGTSQRWYEGIKKRNLCLNAVAGKLRAMFDVNPYDYEEMPPGLYDVHDRLRDVSQGVRR